MRQVCMGARARVVRFDPHDCVRGGVSAAMLARLAAAAAAAAVATRPTQTPPRPALRGLSRGGRSPAYRGGADGRLRDSPPPPIASPSRIARVGWVDDAHACAQRDGGGGGGVPARLYSANEGRGRDDGGNRYDYFFFFIIIPPILLLIIGHVRFFFSLPKRVKKKKNERLSTRLTCALQTCRLGENTVRCSARKVTATRFVVIRHVADLSRRVTAAATNETPE